MFKKKKEDILWFLKVNYARRLTESCNGINQMFTVIIQTKRKYFFWNDVYYVYLSNHLVWKSNLIVFLEKSINQISHCCSLCFLNWLLIEFENYRKRIFLKEVFQYKFIMLKRDRVCYFLSWIMLLICNLNYILFILDMEVDCKL